MMTTNHQQQLLQEMGITVWKTRSEAPTHHAYWVVVSEAEVGDQAKRSLLQRMTSALQWPAESYAMMGCTASQTPNDWQRQLHKKQPQKILVCGLGLAQQLGYPQAQGIIQLEIADRLAQIAIIPSLDQIITDPTAKRTAWQTMQSFLP